MTPQPSDVICGRGCGRYSKTPGNLAFRKLVKEAMSRYEAAEKFRKVVISRAIVEQIADNNGRFLTRKSPTSEWTILTEKKAIEKTSQTFRDLRHSKPTRLMTAQPAFRTEKARTAKNSKLIKPKDEKEISNVQDIRHISKEQSTDILCGTGFASSKHVANQAFLRIINLNKAKYLFSSNNKEQLQLCQNIVAMIRKQGGRFLERDPSTNSWQEMSDEIAVKMVASAFLQTSDSVVMPNGNDFMGLCAWLSGVTVQELKAHDSLLGCRNCIEDVPRSTDIIVGRDKRNSIHPGNLAFRWIADFYASEYMACSPRRKKLDLIEAIVATIQNQGGRFVELDTSSNIPIEIQDQKAITETSLCLRRASSRSLGTPNEIDFLDLCQVISSKSQDKDSGGVELEKKERTTMEPSNLQAEQLMCADEANCILPLPPVEKCFPVRATSLALSDDWSIWNEFDAMPTYPITYELSWCRVKETESKQIEPRVRSGEEKPESEMKGYQRTDEPTNTVDALQFLPDCSNHEDFALQAIPAPPIFRGTQSFGALWEMETESMHT